MTARGTWLGRAVPLSIFVRTSLAVALLGLQFPSVTAQTPQAPAQPPAKKAPPAVVPQQKAQAEAWPTARAIIDRHIAAVGGRKVILAHSSTHATGTVTIAGSGVTGTFELFSAKPNLTTLKISLGGIGDVYEGFDGTVAWNKSPMTGPMLSQGKELEQKKFDADYFADLHDASRYASMKTVDKTTFDGRPCYKVSLVRKDGGEDFEFYEVESGLKAGSLATRETSMGSITATQVVSDYKKFGDVLQPSVVKQSAMGVQQVLTFTLIEYDKVDPAVFALPADIKVLVK
jgi:hypothetical protein